MKRNNQKLSSLTLFFPAYNEAGNIAECIKQANQIAKQVADRYEIIVINDGSTDTTKQIVTRLLEKYSNLRLINQHNKGYGGALKRGFKKAKYEWIFFSDSDLQFDFAELHTFIAHTQNSKLILGYRKNRAEGLKRQLLASALKIWNRVLLGFPSKIKDIDCAFKLIHKDVLKLTGALISDGAMVSTEFLLKAYRLDIEFTQIGVTHYSRAHGNPTGSSAKVILKAVRDTFILQGQLVNQQLKNLTISTKHLPVSS